MYLREVLVCVTSASCNWLCVSTDACQHVVHSIPSVIRQNFRQGRDAQLQKCPDGWIIIICGGGVVLLQYFDLHLQYCGIPAASITSKLPFHPCSLPRLGTQLPFPPPMQCSHESASSGPKWKWCMVHAFDGARAFECP